MKYEEWFLDQVRNIVYKNPFSECTNKCYEDLSKSIKNSLKRQRISPNDKDFEKMVQFGILKFTKFTIKQIVNIGNFYHKTYWEDFDQFQAIFKSHQHFYKDYINSNETDDIPYHEWFREQFSDAHAELSKIYKTPSKEYKLKDN